MGDVTITRGVGARDDYPDASLTQTNSASVSAVTLASDGDVLTHTGTFTSPTVGDTAIVYRAVSPSLSSTVYNKIIARGRIDGLPANYTVQAAALTSSGTPIGQVVLGSAIQTGFTTVNSFLFTGNNIARLAVIVSAGTGAGTGSFNISWDFCYVFKEILTLPAITQPLPMSAGRIIAVLPIIGKEGEILQDLGSKSPEIVIQGALVSTTTPTNHTAAEWWDLLEGLVLEGANETWQWVSSDRIHYKYLPIDLTRSEQLSRKNYYEFTLRLKRFDVLSQTADRLGINY